NDIVEHIDQLCRHCRQRQLKKQFPKWFCPEKFLIFSFSACGAAGDSGSILFEFILLCICLSHYFPLLSSSRRVLSNILWKNRVCASSSSWPNPSRTASKNSLLTSSIISVTGFA